MGQLSVVMLLLLISLGVKAEQRPNLVLLPVQVDEANQSLSGEFGNKIQGSLQEGYKVFFGAAVEAELEKIYQRISDRIDCDGAMCNREIALAFNAEWIGYPSIKSLAGGYIASLAIRNVFTGETRFSESLPCRGCDAFDLLDKLPDLGRLAVAGHAANSEEIKTTVKPTSNASISSDEVDKSRQNDAVDKSDRALVTFPSGETVTTTDSGLQYEVMDAVESDAEKPTPADRVTIHMRAASASGNVFDSTFKRGKPITFPLRSLIPGLVEGLQLMKVGEKFKFFIPAELGYGSRSPSSAVPANSALIFEVELLEIR